MLVCYPQLLHNFVYKSPSWRNLSSLAGAVDLIRFFCSRDLTISQARRGLVAGGGGCVPLTKRSASCAPKALAPAPATDTKRRQQGRNRRKARTHAQAFCRKFDWTKLMLWPEELPERSVVALSGLDDLVPSSLVLRQLQVAGHPAKVLHHPEAGHGSILLMNDWQRALLACLRGLVAQDCILD